MTRLLLLVTCAGVLAGCLEERARPSPVEPTVAARLSVQVLAPRDGITVATGSELAVRIHARDLDARGLTGVGFVVRRFVGNRPTLDSAAVHFQARADSVHDFVFRVPTDLPTNAQLDFYGVAWGTGAQVRVSPASSLVVVN